MADAEATFARFKQTLDRLSEEVAQGKFPEPILKDLKLAVDQLRLTLWASLAYESKGRTDARGVDFGLGTKLAEFRIKRLRQALADLQEDIQGGEIPPSDPELPSLASALQSALENIHRLMGKAR